MSSFTRPGVFAALLCGAALVLHPASGAVLWLPAQPAILAALLVLAVLALAGRAAGARERRGAAIVTASGAVVLLAALGVDGLRGHHGAMSLAAGQSRGNFEEEDPAGRSLGLRPFGFAVGAERVTEDGVALAFSGRSEPAELTPARAVGFGGYRFARPRAATTGGAARLRVAAAGAGRTLVADVSPDTPGRAGDLTIALEQYFPDFALDDRQQPYSRSSEPRNPAALLTIGRGGKTYRAFVLQSMPGVHRVEGLGLAFSLLGVEPERAAEIAVHREPAAPVALVGALLLAVGLAFSLPLSRAPASDPDPDAPVLVAGAAQVALLMLVDRGAVLGWSLGVPAAAGRAPLAGAGVLLGSALIAALAGCLLLAAMRLAGGPEGVRQPGRAALGLAALLAGAGLLLAVVRVASLPGEAGSSSWQPLVGIAAATVILSGSLVATRKGAPPLASRLGALALPLAALAALALAIALAVSGVLRDGTYATHAAAAAAATGLLGLSALETTGAPGPRRVAFLVALLALALR
jgi:hypothetical protein